MVLDKNPDNFFAQIEQAAFEPANMVPGIGPSPDKMLLGRMFSAIPDTHRYRIGPNYLQLPVNQTEGQRKQLQLRRPDALPALRRPTTLRAQQLRRPGGRHRSLPRHYLGDRRW